MEFLDGFDLGYDLGYEDGAWAGYYYGIEKLKTLLLKQNGLVFVGTIIITVPITLIAMKLFKRIKASTIKKLGNSRNIQLELESII